jgi:lysine 2,3-aminomutase
MEPLITSIEGLPAALAASVSPEEKIYVEAIRRRGVLPFGVTRHFASLARPGRGDPIRRQFFPDPREALPDPFALDDPLGEHCHCAILPGSGIAPRLVHQYRDRALLLAGGACAGYCRYCFRRVWLAASPGFINPEDAASAAVYLAAHAEIREALVSGGDPLTADNARLAELFGRLRQARPGVLLRVCSRAPITWPARLDDGTIDLFRRFRPLRLSVHINHPRELEPPGAAAGSLPGAAGRLAACAAAGIPVLVQTVLLRGINDDPAVLAELFCRCRELGLSPYYLFQLDLAPGTAHFRVPLTQGLAVYRELGSLVPGPALPVYAVDLPGGGGKVRLRDGVIAGKTTTAAGPAYLLRDAGGKLWEYPAG